MIRQIKNYVSPGLFGVAILGAILCIVLKRRQHKHEL